MDIEGIEIRWLGHAGFLIKNSPPQAYPEKSSTKIFTKGKIIYIDPYHIGESDEKADLILLTHSHYDHCSVEDMEKIVKVGTKIIAPADCQSKIARFNIPIKMEIMEPNQELDLQSVKILTLPAYNIDKPFHSKEEGGVGYLIKFGKVIIYHAGDTDVIEEMQKLTGHKHKDKKFVALLPVGGRFTMSAEEAAEAAKLIKPDLAIPMHYGSVIGSQEDAEEFVEICKENKIKTQILERK